MISSWLNTVRIPPRRTIKLQRIQGNLAARWLTEEKAGTGNDESFPFKVRIDLPCLDTIVVVLLRAINAGVSVLMLQMVSNWSDV